MGETRSIQNNPSLNSREANDSIIYLLCHMGQCMRCGFVCCKSGRALFSLRRSINIKRGDGDDAAKKEATPCAVGADFAMDVGGGNFRGLSERIQRDAKSCGHLRGKQMPQSCGALHGGSGF